VETINLLLYRRYDEDINAAISAIRGDDAMQRPVWWRAMLTGRGRRCRRVLCRHRAPLLAQ
jgi:hypothetical protein